MRTEDMNEFEQNENSHKEEKNGESRRHHSGTHRHRSSHRSSSHSDKTKRKKKTKEIDITDQRAIYEAKKKKRVKKSKAELRREKKMILKMIGFMIIAIPILIIIVNFLDKSLRGLAD